MVEAAASTLASAKAWEKCLSRVFEVDPLVCVQCGGRLVPVAAILADKQLVRVLAYLKLPTEFPKLAPARGPRAPAVEESQIGPDPPLSEGIDWVPPDDTQAPGGDWLLDA